MYERGGHNYRVSGRGEDAVMERWGSACTEVCVPDCVQVCLVQSTKMKVIALRDDDRHKYVFIFAVVKLIDSNVVWEKAGH